MSLDLTRVKMLAPRAAVAGAPDVGVGASGGASAVPWLDEAALAKLCDAFLAEDDGPRRAAVDGLRACGVPTADIVGDVVPRLARRLGRLWAEDDLCFAEVTIGSARLQETVRAFSRSRNAARGGNAGSVLLVVPRGEHHTLGAFVAADAFRRSGFAVEVAVDRYPREIVAALGRSRFAMVGITASSRRSLASVRDLVDTIRASATRATPLVLGGSLVATGCGLDRINGVDHVAEDIGSALAFCRSRGVDLERAHGAP